MMGNLGAIFGPLLALGLVAALGVRWAIGLSVIPGLLAAAAIVYTIRHTAVPHKRDRMPSASEYGHCCAATLGRLMAAVAAFEAGNVAATLLILRATELLTPGHGIKTATTLTLALYILYNLAATIASLPVGRVADRHGPILVLAAGTAPFLTAYLGFATTWPAPRDPRLAVRRGRHRDRLRRDRPTLGRRRTRPIRAPRVSLRTARHHPGRRQRRRELRRRDPLDRRVAAGGVLLPGRLDAARPRRHGLHRTPTG
jgi:hypothetical protein